nr:calcium/proton exchanger [Tanacetum cinerariifolium]
MADDDNESSDAYCSSDEEDLSYVDFHSKLDDNVVINTSLKPEHNCSRNYNLGSLVTYKWIAHHYAKKLIADPFTPYLKMKNEIREKFIINVSIGQCKRANQRALFDYEGGSKVGRKMTCTSCQETCHNKSSCKKQPVPKRPKVNRPSVPKLHEYGTYTSARGKGRGSKGGRGGFGGRGEGTATIGESSATIRAIGRSQRGMGRGQRVRSKGQRGRGKGWMQRDEMTEVEIRKNLEHDYMEDILL